MGLHLDQVDATNLGSSASNSMPTNFEDVPVLNPVAIRLHKTPSTSLGTDLFAKPLLACKQKQ